MPTEPEAVRRRQALDRAVTIGSALSTFSVLCAVLLWIVALRQPGGLAIGQALLVTVAAAVFTGFTVQARRRKGRLD